MNARLNVPNSAEDSEILAIEALQYLAADEDRLGRFLALTGLSPDDLRRAAGERGVLGAIVGYLMSDERLLLDFAAETERPPEAVSVAYTLLTGEPAEW